MRVRFKYLFGKPKPQGEPIPVIVDPILHDIVDGYLEDALDQADALEEACKQKDFDAVGKLAFTMSGQGGSFGFDQISVWGDELVKAAKEAKTDVIDDIVPKYKDYLTRVQVSYDLKKRTERPPEES
ncbi:MAG: hypothetical protein AABZ44_03355 [Elusimicrobiota bacterium]